MIVGRAPTHTFKIFRKYGCLSTRYLIYTLHSVQNTERRRERNTVDLFGLIYAFVLILLAVALPVQTSHQPPFSHSRALSLVCSHFPHNCLSLSKILLRQLLSTSPPPSTILFNCTIAIVCRMHSDLVNREKTVCCKM